MKHSWKSRVRSRAGATCVLVATLASGMAACKAEQSEEATGTTESALVFHLPLKVGVRCQQEYQNNWQPLLFQVYQNCWDFGDQMSRDNEWTFYFNLHGAKASLESQYDGFGVGAGSADTVDFLFMYTHGVINPYRDNTAEYEMWDDGYTVHADAMRLGDNSVGASVLATYSCNTMAIDNGDIWRRWIPTFAGGLRIALGGHDVFYDVPNTGRGFAAQIQNGGPLAQAWFDATLASDAENHPIAVTTGRNPDDCWGRHDMSIIDVTWKERLRDSDIGYMCWTYWN